MRAGRGGAGQSSRRTSGLGLGGRAAVEGGSGQGSVRRPTSRGRLGVLVFSAKTGGGPRGGLSRRWGALTSKIIAMPASGLGGSQGAALSSGRTGGAGKG